MRLCRVSLRERQKKTWRRRGGPVPGDVEECRRLRWRSSLCCPPSTAEKRRSACSTALVRLTS